LPSAFSAELRFPILFVELPLKIVKNYLRAVEKQKKLFVAFEYGLLIHRNLWEWRGDNYKKI
jgi:hypothetical protein